MGLLTGGIAPSSSIVAQTTQANISKGTDGGPHNQTAPSAQLMSQAGMISLSASSKNRVASFGEGRSVDASFDKNASRNATDKEKSEGVDRQENGDSEKGGKLNIVA
ncbi:MAG: hypothetical protein PHC51_13510 [bacterium]|nr:hypothetical protein [bacterium]